MKKATERANKQHFLFFTTENLEIKYYAFSETAVGKRGPFGAARDLKGNED